MKHHKKTRKFGREKGQRDALLKALAHGLILHDAIKTSEAKAKELRPFIEKLITKGKIGTPHARRLLNSRVGIDAGEKLITTIAPKYKDRKGGYTRIIKLGRRISDGSPMARIELV